MEGPTFVSTLLALLVFALAIVTRRPIESLLCGALVGLAMLHGANLLPEFAATSLRVMTDEDVAWIILVCGFMGSLIALLLWAGGFAAFSSFLRARVRLASGVLMGTWVFGLVLFVDDYMNSLAAGEASLAEASVTEPRQGSGRGFPSSWAPWWCSCWRPSGSTGTS